MMNEHVKRADRLKAEASKLLDDLHLIDILSHHGDIRITGSYQYDLMTRRDIDICIGHEDPSIDVAFALGLEISMLPWVGSMYYRNEYILRTPGIPMAIFWCVEVIPPGNEKWKVDILLAKPDEVARVMNTSMSLLRELDKEKRNRILKIKGPLSTANEYGQSIRSTDIYEAVMNAGVMNLKGWKVWWKNKSDIDSSKRTTQN
jgi:hypothetical protein